MAQLRFKHYVVIAAGVLLIAGSLSLAHVNPVGGAGSAPVTVVNQTTNPVPVIGNVAVAGTSNVNVTNTSIPVTGSVNAAQSGSWNVGITGTPAVTITGPVTTVPGSVPADTAVQFNLRLESDACGSSTNFYTVPPGHRLVIDFVSASASTVDNPDATFALRINTTLDGAPHFHILPMPKQRVENGSNPFAAFANAIPMRAYADANTKVCTTLDYLFSGPVIGILVAFSGHLVPNP